MDRKPLKKIFVKKLYKFFLIIVITFVAAELLTRIFYKEHLDRYTTKPQIYQPDSVIGFTYIPNTVFNKGSQKVIINSEGYLWDEFSIKKREGTFRIAFIGACNVSGVLRFNVYSNFCTTLQGRFKENNWNVEVLNCGIDGMESYPLFQSIRYKIVNYQPDLILSEYLIPFTSYNCSRETYRGYVLYYAKDNQVLRQKTKQMVDEMYKYRTFFMVYDHLYAIRALCNYYMHRSQTKLSMMIKYYYEGKIYMDYGISKRFSDEKSIELTQKLLGELKEEDTRMFYYQYGKNSSLIQGCKQNHIPLISLGLQFTPEMYHENDSHFNPEGHRIIGEKFYELLTKYQVIPQEFKNQ